MPPNLPPPASQQSIRCFEVDFPTCRPAISAESWTVKLCRVERLNWILPTAALLAAPENL